MTGQMKCEDAQIKELGKYSAMEVTDGNYKFSTITE
jgi:hypothetical protein